jgi:NADH-quinone oxidoreductase subunit D
MQIRLFDLDNKREVVVEIDGKAHIGDLIQKLRELGVLKQNETAMVGVPLDDKRIAYVPSVNLEQLVAYVNQKKTVIAFRRYPIHGHKP